MSVTRVLKTLRLIPVLVIHVLEILLMIPLIAAASAIVIVGVVDAWRFAKSAFPEKQVSVQAIDSRTAGNVGRQSQSHDRTSICNIE